MLALRTLTSLEHVTRKFGRLTKDISAFRIDRLSAIESATLKAQLHDIKEFVRKLEAQIAEQCGGTTEPR